MTDGEIHAEAKRRVMRANPTITAEAFDEWLALALSRGASIILQLDGCRAAYDVSDAHTFKVRAAKGRI